MRYPLQLIINKQITFDKYFNAFIKSTEFKTDTNEKEFVELWESALPYLQSKQLTNYAEDLKYITNLLGNKQYLIHHSETYREKYQPAYRVINKLYLQ
jgi:hypothetical protein